MIKQIFHAIEKFFTWSESEIDGATAITLTLSRNQCKVLLNALTEARDWTLEHVNCGVDNPLMISRYDLIVWLNEKLNENERQNHNNHPNKTAIR